MGCRHRSRCWHRHDGHSFPFQGESSATCFWAPATGSRLYHLSGRTAGHRLHLSDRTDVCIQQNHIVILGAYGYLCLCPLHEPAADIQPVPGWRLPHYPVAGLHPSGEGRQRGFYTGAAQVVQLHYRSDGHHLHLRMDMAREHRDALWCQRERYDYRRMPCLAHLRCQSHPLLLHLHHHDCL